MTTREKKPRGYQAGLVVCVVIIALLGIGFILTYQKLQSQIMTYESYVASHGHSNSEFDNLQASYNTLQSSHNNYVTNHHYTDSEYDALKSEKDLLNDIVKLNKYQILVSSETISQPARYYTYWTFSVKYAGYISVNVEFSTTTNTYVQVVYSAYGVNFDNTITVGVSGIAVFPVLPSNNIQVRVGNTNLLGGATETVTVIYYY